MAKAKKTASRSKKKPIEQYAHKGKQRANNPPVGLVTPQTDKDSGKRLTPTIGIVSHRFVFIFGPRHIFASAACRLSENSRTVGEKFY